ncbi:uncharacterized protein UDID_18452 [Ustilago sp. UG-2017a]|nr:uncharacterized protein UDID_18452 [Ustilago sp. UG-2017a]
MSTTDPGGIRDSTFTHTDLTEICHRADSTADLSELCCKSYNLPDPLIPALPSYESTGLPASCAFRPMTRDCTTAFSGRDLLLVAALCKPASLDLAPCEALE